MKSFDKNTSMGRASAFDKNTSMGRASAFDKNTSQGKFNPADITAGFGQAGASEDAQRDQDADDAQNPGRPGR
ncbi:MAG: hypothetical protein INR69_07110 [Mucilaginibacter polytrichastri]|nr:hypothetical protein [Mucilaginibacter polytrichastri]